MRQVTCLACLVLVSIWFVGCEGEKGSATMEKAKETGAKAMAPEAKSAEKAEKPAAAEAKGQSTAEANSLLDQANTALKDGKLDQAQQAVDKLQSLKGSLPESMQKKIDSTAQALAKAKAAKTDPTSLIPQKAPAKK